MPTIQERTDAQGRTRYRVQVRLKGCPPQSATFDRKTDARRWAQQTEADMKAGRYFGTAQSKKRTFGEMVDRYVRDVLPSKGENTGRVQTTELQWWKERLGHFVLADVTPAVIAETRDELARGITRDGSPRSPSTVIHYMAALSHCFTVAVKEWGWLDDTPMQKVSKPHGSRGRVRFLSDDERERLLDACSRSESAYLYPIVVLALSTGMRRSEILNLTWDRVDLQRRMVTLRPEDTKTRETRGVPLVGRALETLRELSKERRIDTQLVFPAPFSDGRSPKPIDIESAWRTALRRAGITDFRFHDLRHSAASYLAMSGATLAEIAEVLGHKTLQMVKRYSHLTEAHTSKVVERMNRRIFEYPAAGR